MEKMSRDKPHYSSKKRGIRLHRLIIGLFKTPDNLVTYRSFLRTTVFYSYKLPSYLFISYNCYHMRNRLGRS
jgi:hypothetical protein